MLSKLVGQISQDFNLTQDQSERVVDMVLTEVKQKLPDGFQRNFVAVMNGEREFNVMDNFGGVLGSSSHHSNGEGKTAWSDIDGWKKKISNSLSGFKKKDDA